MEFRILGHLDVVAGGNAIELEATKERVLLGVLLLNANHTVSVDHLSDALWGDRQTGRSIGTLRAHVSYLRKALRRVSEPAREVIVTRNPGYVIELGVDELDATCFETLADRGRARLREGQPDKAAEVLGKALALWRGPVLGDLAFSVADYPEMARLSEAKLCALEDRVEADLACGRHDALVGEIEALVSENPLRERLWGHRILALYRSGRQADALRAYQQLRRLLDEELGIEPSPELRRLEEAVLLQKPEVDWKSPGDRATRPPLADKQGRDSATAAFVLTDIENSSRLWETRPEQMVAAASRYEDIVARVVSAHAGLLVKALSEGDGAFSVFQSARQGVAAALDLNLAFEVEPWPAGLALRPRITVHFGEADVTDGGYFGPAIDRATRLGAIGHSGQVLLSQVAAELARDGLPVDASLKDLGAHRLRDFTRPERIWQLMHPALQAAFGPLRSLDARLTNLPVETTSFVGREEELARFADLLRSTRLLTLTGPGGSGKTRLARRAAAAAIDTYPDGVWLVELAPLVQERLVPAAVAAALHVVEQPGRDVIDSLLDDVVHKQLLIVLDNCEHVLDGAAALAASILSSAEGVRILATSRERLGVDGEATWPVPPLTLPEAGGDAVEVGGSEAVRLFVDRAVAAVPSFNLGPGNQIAVADICTRLDGLPLAIELAAARVRLLSPDQLSARLGDRFRLLSSGNRTVLPRHRTLEALVEWSYDLLDAEERILLDRLSVFRGGFTLEGATAVGQGDPLSEADVFILLAELTEKSLVQVADTGHGVRYGLLETIREYAASRLEQAGATEAVRQRHSGWCLLLARRAEAEMGGPDATRLLDELEAEHDNVRAAVKASAADPAALHGLAASLAPFWLARGHWSEGRYWLSAALASHTGPDRGRALAALGNLEAFAGDNETAVGHFEQALEELREAHDEQGLIDALGHLGRLHMQVGRFAAARSAQEEGLALARTRGVPGEVGRMLERLSETVSRTGDYDAERSLNAEALELFRQIGDRQGEASALHGLGRGCLRAGDVLGGKQHLSAAVALYKDLQNPFGVAITAHGLGRAALAGSDMSMARYHLQESLAGFVEIGGDARGVAHCVHDLGLIAVRTGQPDLGVRLLGAAHRGLAEFGLVLSDEEQKENEALAAEAKDLLGEEMFGVHWAVGASLGLDKAVKQASALTVSSA